MVHCFEVQERVTKMLEQVETLALTETTASTTAAAPAPATTSEPEFYCLWKTNPGNVTSAPTGNAKTTGEEDPFGNVVFGSTSQRCPHHLLLPRQTSLPILMTSSPDVSSKDHNRFLPNISKTCI